MLAPDGKPMCRVPARKARFYLDKGLAQVVTLEAELVWVTNKEKQERKWRRYLRQLVVHLL